MESILFNISQVLGITIIYSLWQGLMVFLILKIALMFFARKSSSVKHLLALSGLLAISAWFIYTLVTEINVYTWFAVKPENLQIMPLMLDLPVSVRPVHAEITRYYYNIERCLPFITLLYAAGLLFNAGRLIVAHKSIRNMKRTIKPDLWMQKQVSKFSAMLGINHEVIVGFSKFVDIPCMAGYIKPVILLPFTLSTYLSAAEIEAILLHELAHIKRNDYLINVLQQLITVLLFFNPFTMLINRIINRERENSCDDLVVGMVNDPVTYARALLKLEDNRVSNRQLALAATGKRFNLLQRIERIVADKQPTPSVRPALLAMLILTICISSFAFLKPEIAHGEISVKAIKPAIKTAIVAMVPKETAAAPDINPPPAEDTIRKIDHRVTDTIKEDYSNKYQLFGYDDPKMDSLSAELTKHEKFVKQYYNTDEYKKLQKITNGSGYLSYDNDTLKNIMEKYNPALNRFKEIALATTNSVIVKSRDSLGILIGVYYSSAGFKALNRMLEEKYNIDPNEDYLTSNPAPNYIKYQAELKSGMPAKIKQEVADLENLTAQMNEMFSSSGAYKTSFREFKLWSDSLKAYYKKPHVRQHEYSGNSKDNIPASEKEKYFQQLRAYMDSPELSREMALEKESADKLFAYMRSPEFRKHLREWKAQLHATLGDRYDKILHPNNLEGDN